VALLLAIFGVGKSILNACLTWLSRQSPATLLCIALAVLLLVDHGALLMSHRHAAKVEGQLKSAISARDNYKHQLDSISTKKNQQQVVTKTNIVTVTKLVHDANGKAEEVEKAPPASGCKTKPEVLGADL
jgi:hypothetical protein